GYDCAAFEAGEISWGEGLVHSEDREQVWNEVQRAIDGNDLFELTYRIETKDGSRKWVWERGRGVDYEGSDEPTIIEGFVTDISDRKLQQERLRVLFDDADDAVVEVTFDGPTALIHAVNPAFEGIFGIAQEDAIGRPINEVIVPEEDRRLASELDRRVKHGEIVEEELLRETADGPRWFLLRTVPFTLHEEPRAYATYVDITEQKEREHALQALHEATQSMFDTNDESEICAISVEAAAEILHLPLTGVNLLDRETGRLEPVAVSEGVRQRFVEPPSYTVEDDLVWSAYRGDEPLIVTDGDAITQGISRGTSPAQSAIIVPLDSQGVMIGSSPSVSTFDESDVRLAALLSSATETALAAARHENQLTLLHDAAAQIGAAETPGEVYERIVAVAEDILEFDFAVADAVEGEQLVTRATSESIEQVSYYQTTPIDAEDNVAARSFRRGEPDLTRDLREIDAAPADPTFRSALTVPIGEHGIFQAAARQEDAFDEKDLELAELLIAHASEALTRLERTSELEEHTQALNRQNERLEKFASIVSHDLRNPLNVATGQLTLAGDECDSAHLEEVSNALDRMEALIEDTLALARQGRTVAEREPIDLASHVGDCWDLVESPAATLVVEDSATLLGDPERVRQVFENLFRNAVEHGGDGVTVRVGTSGDGLFVEDDGPGIPPEERADVFRSQYSTTGDSGFGLAIVTEIVEAHGWSIDVTEGVDGGARFEITGIEFGE
ncbi:MAG: GAF domain-containing protein, partial [Halobacteriota archaeon]